MPSASTASSSSSTSSIYPLAIIDVGASLLRITLQPGPPAAMAPTTHTCPNAIIRTRAPQRAVLVGSDIESRCTDYSCVTIRCPVERGFVTDWMAQKSIWDVEIPRALASLPGSSKKAMTTPGDTGSLLSGFNVIITEAYFNLPELETGIETLFLEEYGANAVWRTTAAQLASFSPPVEPTSKKVKTATTDPTLPLEESSESTADTSGIEAVQQPTRSPTSPTSALSPPAPARSSGRSKRKSSSSGTDDPMLAASPPSKSKTSASRAVRRPEACVMIDLGHSYTHVVPLIHGEVVWSATRRLDIGGKVMTNLLKEAISFTQWDVMEESWIIDQLKRQALFVAASEWDEDKTRPSGWDRRALMRLRSQLAQKPKNARLDPIEQEFVLPDYTDRSVARDPLQRYGRLRCGPGASVSKSAAAGEREADDAFIADTSLIVERDVNLVQVPEDEGTDDEDADAGEDYQDSGSGSELEIEPPTTKQKPAPKAAKPQPHRSAVPIDDEDDEQTVRLSQERWQIPELLFHPQQLGLDALGLPELIFASIEAASSDPAVRGLMYANICLFGGMAGMCGLRRRLEYDLRALCEEDYHVRIRTCTEPSLTAVNGALTVPVRFVQSHLLRREEAAGTAGVASVSARERFRSWGF